MPSSDPSDAPPTATIGNSFGATPNSGATHNSGSPAFGSPRVPNTQSNSPSVPRYSPLQVGATSQDMGGEEDIPHAEYEWAVMLKDGLHDGIKVPDIATESFDFERWEKNLLRTMVGKMPYMLKPDGSRLIEYADTPFQRRGNRALYSAIWDKLTEKSST